jgi:hypothetical protein
MSGMTVLSVHGERPGPSEFSQNLSKTSRYFWQGITIFQQNNQ